MQCTIWILDSYVPVEECAIYGAIDKAEIKERAPTKQRPPSRGRSVSTEFLALLITHNLLSFYLLSGNETYLGHLAKWQEATDFTSSSIILISTFHSCQKLTQELTAKEDWF